MNTPWATLGVHRMSTDAQVRDSYLTRAKELHPDVGGTVEAMASLGAAYKLLATAAARAALAMLYDRYGKPCGYCKGRGAIAKGKGITKVDYSACHHCGGSGVLLTKEVSYESIKLSGTKGAGGKWRDKSK